MINAQDLLIKSAMPAAGGVVTFTTTSASIPASGVAGVNMPECEFLVCLVHFGAVGTNTTSNGISGLTVQGSDDTSTSFANPVTLHNFFSPSNGTAYNSASTDDGKWLYALIDVRNKKHNAVRLNVTITGTGVGIDIAEVLFIGINNKLVPPTGNFDARQLVTQLSAA